jgi:hypothetical protein
MFNQYEAHSADISESRIMNPLMSAVNKVLGTKRPKSLMRTSFALILEQSPHPTDAIWQPNCLT